MKFIPKFQRGNKFDPISESTYIKPVQDLKETEKILKLAKLKKENGVISAAENPIKQKLITNTTKVLKKFEKDILPPLALASMVSPYTRPLGQAYLVSKLEENNIDAEAVNTAHSRATNNYPSEFAGGLVDAKQALEELKKGNLLYKEGNYGAIPQAIWAMSGLVEPKAGSLRTVDSFIEYTKAAGDFSDVAPPVVKKIVKPLYSKALEEYLKSKERQKIAKNQNGGSLNIQETLNTILELWKK